MDPLARFVDDEQAFHHTLWRRTPAVLHPRTPPMEMLTVAELDRILDAGLLTTPYATLVQEDGPVPEERYCSPVSSWAGSTTATWMPGRCAD